MEKLGIDYETAENGAIAVQKYQEAPCPFNLVLMGSSYHSIGIIYLTLGCRHIDARNGWDGGIEEDSCF
jgi:hypothetical protein